MDRVMYSLKNRPFFSCLASNLAFNWVWGRGWPCFDTNLFCLLMFLWNLWLKNRSLHKINMVPKQYATRPRCAIFKHTMYKYFSNLTKMVPFHQILKFILIPLRKSPIFDPFVVRENVKIWLKMFWISLSKLGFTLKEIDLSVFSSLQRHFLHLPDFLLFSRASAPAKRAQRSPIRKRKLKPIDPKKKSPKQSWS